MSSAAVATPPAAPRKDRTLAPFDAAAGEEIADIRFFGKAAVLVNREEFIHELLVEKASAFRKGPLLSVNARPLLGRGLLTGPNDLNRRQRRVISPAFAHKKVADYAGVVSRYTERRIVSWKSGQTVDMAQEMLSLTLGIIGEMLLSADLLGASEDIGEAITTVMHFAIDEQRDPWNAFRSVPRALMALFFLNRTIYGRIHERRRNGAGDSADEADLLSLLLFARDTEKGGPYMDDKLIRDEAMTLFLAGLETVANALTWSLYLLATHPDVAARLRAEVDRVGETHGLTMDDLPRLPYTMQVFKEAMRLYPPAYILARQALESVTLGPRALRRGEVVFASPYVRHRRPENFPDPLRFDPDRWADPNAEKRLPGRYTYFPFGGGPRVCVGGHFAMMESHLILASLVRRITFDLVPGQTIEPEPLFSLRPRNGLYLTLSHRG